MNILKLDFFIKGEDTGLYYILYFRKNFYNSWNRSQELLYMLIEDKELLLPFYFLELVYIGGL